MVGRTGRETNFGENAGIEDFVGDEPFKLLYILKFKLSECQNLWRWIMRENFFFSSIWTLIPVSYMRACRALGGSYYYKITTAFDLHCHC